MLAPEGNGSYCDANQVTKRCPEIDLIEADRYGFHLATHGCNKSSGSSTYDWCNIWGCKIDIGADLSYGPSASNKIDTRYPYTVAATFTATQNALSGIGVVLSQKIGTSTKTISATMGQDCTYVAQYPIMVSKDANGVPYPMVTLPNLPNSRRCSADQWCSS